MFFVSPFPNLGFGFLPSWSLLDLFFPFNSSHMASVELAKLLDSVKLTSDEEEVVDLGEKEDGEQQQGVVHLLIGR